MGYRIKVTVMVSAPDNASALRKLQDRIEPTEKQRAENGMYIETVDKIENVK